MGHTRGVNLVANRRSPAGQDTAQIERTPVVRVPEDAHPRADAMDRLAVEEPLEIRLGFGPLDQRQRQPLAITMRTPGDDEELALGFLFSEGIITGPEQLRSLGPCGEDPKDHVIRAELEPDAGFDPARFQRHFYATSSCGVCGKRSLEALRTVGRFDPGDSGFTIAAAALRRLPESLLASQDTFAKTGGLHAAALFDAGGRIEAVREDVGRHNALDKLLGVALQAGLVPLRRHGILVSGRASFELLQKAMMAGCPLFAAIGAPSSLAVAAAREFDIALAGFLRAERFNIYSGDRRITR